jgi:hypothetical protein
LFSRAASARRLVCGHPRAGYGLQFALHGANRASARPPP